MINSRHDQLMPAYRYMVHMNHQCGAATLVISVALLIAVTIIVLFGANTSVMEQRIATNDYRGKQAFEAAEAGIEYAVGRINKETFINLSDSDNDQNVEFACKDGDSPADAPCDVPPLDNGATATVSLTLPASSDLTAIEINSTGFSDDRAASRSVSVLVRLVPILGNPPPAPLVARSNVDLYDTAKISNIATGNAIWSGGSMTLHGGSVVIDGSVNDNPSNLSGVGATEFFDNFFKSTKEQVRAQSKVITQIDNGSTDYSAALNGINGRAVWIDARDGLGNPDAVIIDNATMGATEPVILIVDGFSSLTIINGTQINGLVYVIGPWDNGPNDADIAGLVMVEDDVALRSNFTISYNTGIISALDNVGRYTKVAGSWRDF